MTGSRQTRAENPTPQARKGLFYTGLGIGSWFAIRGVYAALILAAAVAVAQPQAGTGGPRSVVPVSAVVWQPLFVLAAGGLGLLVMFSLRNIRTELVGLRESIDAIKEAQTEGRVSDADTLSRLTHLETGLADLRVHCEKLQEASRRCDLWCTEHDTRINEHWKARHLRDAKDIVQFKKIYDKLDEMEKNCIANHRDDA